MALKKRLCVTAIFACAALIFSACSKADSVKPQLNNITFVADVSYGEEKYTLKSSVASDWTFNARVVSQGETENMQFAISPSGACVSYGDLKFTVEDAALPRENTVQLLYAAIKAAAGENLQKDERKNCSVEGTLYTSRYTFSFSPSGLPLSLVIPDYGYKAVFRNVSVDKNSVSGII